MPDDTRTCETCGGTFTNSGKNVLIQKNLRTGKEECIECAFSPEGSKIENLGGNSGLYCSCGCGTPIKIGERVTLITDKDKGVNLIYLDAHYTQKTRKNKN